MNDYASLDHNSAIPLFAAVRVPTLSWHFRAYRFGQRHLLKDEQCRKRSARTTTKTSRQSTLSAESQMTDPSTETKEESDTSMTEGETQKREQKIREIVVLPAPEVIDARASSQNGGRTDVNTALAEMARALREKGGECEQLVASSSPVSFTANYLQSRVVSTDLGARLAKLYEALEVKRADEFEQRLDKLGTSDDERTVALIAELKDAFREWEAFLARLDEEVEKLAGPNTQTELGESGKEIQLVGHNKMFKSGSLLSYVQSSSYSLMFLEVVASFSAQECYEHVKKMFDSLSEFHKLGCDILLLTRAPTSGGGGFLKLIGMPFRQMLNDNESMRQILMHRQSANSMAGLRALHIYTEFLCNDQPLEIAHQQQDGKEEDEEGGGRKAAEKTLGSQSGCILIDRQGRIRYSYLCTDSSDWPDVEVLLEQVRVTRNARPSTGKPGEEEAQQQRPGTRDNKEQAADGEKSANGVADATSPAAPSSGGEVAAHKRKCCAVM